jgi:hypothetical protein
MIFYERRFLVSQWAHNPLKWRPPLKETSINTKKSQDPLFSLQSGPVVTAIKKYYSMNRLAGELSPYLRQHKNNPIHWFPWGRAAFDEATASEKPIFLSIGYSTCHWCHVMEKECFEECVSSPAIRS